MSGFDPNIKFYRGGGAGIEFTSIVLSADVSTGRNSFVDQYSGATAQVVIKNSNNESSLFPINSSIGIFTGSNIFWRGRVSGVSYNDSKTDAGLSTATIIVDDQFARLGRVKVTNRSISSALGSTQLITFNPSTYGGSGPLTDAYFYELGFPSTPGSASSSTMSASTFTGSVLDYMNAVQATENGNMIVTGDNIAMVSRTMMVNDIYKLQVEDPPGSGTFVTLKLGRTSSDTTVTYDTFSRTNFMDFFANSVSVTPAGLAAQTATNPYSFTTFGEYSYSRSTIDSTTAQGLTLAKNLSQKLSDQTAVMFNISLQLESQNETAADTLIGVISARVVDVVYRVPGSGTDTTTTCVIEGASYSFRPKTTRFTFNLTPLAMYIEFQNFTLDTGFGVLDQDTLG
jgi:hypothetical protein